MKNLITTAILLVSAACFAQNPYTYLKIDNNQLVYENIFIMDSTSAWKIDTLLQHQLQISPGITNIIYCKVV